MMHDVTGGVEEVRGRTIAVLDELVEKAAEFELAEAPPALERYRRKLSENAYKVLVVGEAKRGKSTFVNALIGQDLLPTDVDVATSQVFSVRNQDREGFRLRFEDGSEREIGRDDLSLYGSQVMADAGSMPTLDQIVRWIEVDVPIKFLPPNVDILDTPGLGALYAAHARITHRFVPEADAVIFVFESGQPVIETELELLQEILEVTRNVFFVQTKIDLYSKEDWQSIRSRNEEVLAERFGKRLTDTRVWPVSAMNLRQAAEDPANEEAYLMVSRHDELLAALRGFLARVSGWGRTAEAMLAAAQYYSANHKALSGRLAGFTAQSKQKRSELQKIAIEGKRRFDAEWGPQGQKYRELREELQRAIAVGKQSFGNNVQMGSDIELAQKAKIEAAQSLAEANRVGEEMPGEVVTAAMNVWARVCKEVQHRCVELLGPFAEAVEAAGAPLDPRLANLAAPESGLDGKFKHDYFSMIRNAAGGGMLVMGVGGMASWLLPAAAATALAPVAPFVALPALALLVGGGIRAAVGGQLKTSQQQLKMQLTETLQKVRRHFFDVDLAAGNFSRVDEYFRNLERTVNEQVRKMAQKKSEESQVEISRLTEAIQLGDQERDAKAKQVREQLTAWTRIGKSAKDIMGRIEALEGSKKQ